MNYYRAEEKSEDSLFIRGSDDEEHQSHDETSSTAAATDVRGSRPQTPPYASSTTRVRHYSFAEHLEELDQASPGRYLNQAHQQTRTDPQIQVPYTSLSSSSSTEDESLPQRNDHRHSQPQQQHDSEGNSSNTSSNNTVSADQERQILLLMLLAQVCALHDPTPRTFTVHVLELFEKGILDRQSLRFLFDLGLVPSSPPSNLLMASSSTLDQQHHQQAISPTDRNEAKETASSLSASSTDDKLALVTMTRAHMTYQLQRSLEASAIRSTLEQQEEQQQQRQRQVAADESASPPPGMAGATATATAAGPQNAPPLPPAVSWSAQHHPLSLSRYQREFDQCGLLSSGSFGEVFRAKSKMDLREYAIKRVPFAATGYSRESVQQVVREVLCLAVCDHPNVVRYYTSWLEPSWMTGCGTSGSAGIMSNDGSTTTGTNGGGGGGGDRGGGKGMASKHKLLQDITHMVEGTGGSENLMDDLEAYFIDTGVPRLPQLHGRQHQQQHHHRHFSLDASDNSNSLISDQDSVDGEEYSDWTIDDGQRSSKDDSFLQDLYRSGRTEDRSTPRRRLRDISSTEGQYLGWKPSHQQQQRHHRHQKDRHKKKQNESFRYQICLFIQMQLCHPSSLADWIRERNRSALTTVPAKRRLEPAVVIFSQIAHGLAHVHSKGIIHRDLKPANVFCSVEGDGLQFKIGDFGLSKLIRRVRVAASPEKHQHHNWNQQQDDDHKHHNLFLTIKQSGDQVEGSSSTRNNGEPSWQDPLTAGIGTASYAAPEQVSSRSYGKEADIFSLGLMLLELVCSFSTEHERIQTFHDCRYRRKLPTAKHEQELFEEFPVLAQTILKCTDPSPEKRPTAHQLSNVNLMDTSSTCSRRRANVGVVDDAGDEATLAVKVVDAETEESVVWRQLEESNSKQVLVLQKHLAEKDEKLKACERVISEKDDIIASLRGQVHALQQQLQQQTANSATTIRLDLSDVEAESSCAEPAASCSSNSSSDEGGL